MTRADLILASPWLLLGTGLLAILVLSAFLRRPALIADVSAALHTLVAGLAAWLALGGARGLETSFDLVAPDGTAFLLCALLAGSGAVVTRLARGYLVGREEDPEEFHVLVPCAVFGAMALAAADHFATLVLGLEILSVALYALVAYPQRNDHAVEAGLKYLVLSGVASTTMLLGIAFLYAQTGSLHLDALGGAGRAAPDDPLVLAGAALVLAAVAFKLSLAPFHLWTPDVYQGAPAPSAALLATIGKSALVIALLRVVLASEPAADGPVSAMLTVLAVLSMIAGNLLALLQRSLKRVLAYSSIAHMGYLVIALLAIGPGAPTPALGVEATVAYLIAYTIVTLAAFAVIAALSPADRPDDVDDEEALAGLFWRRPLHATVLTIALLSLAGIPLTAGFVGKFYVIAAGVEHGAWLLLGSLLVGSGIGLFYYLRILHALVRTTAREPVPLAPSTSGVPWVLALLAGATVALGLWPAWLVDLVRTSLLP